MKILNEYLCLEKMKDFKQLFLSRGECKIYKRNELFVRKGQTNHFMGFVHSGAFCCFDHRQDGKEQIIGFSFDNDFVTHYPSFLYQTQSLINIKSIKDSEVYVLPYREIRDFFYKDEENLIFSKHLAEALFAEAYECLISIYCDTAEERYIKLINTYPDLLSLITLKELADLIMVAPETLSRIRKKISLLQGS